MPEGEDYRIVNYPVTLISKLASNSADPTAVFDPSSSDIGTPTLSTDGNALKAYLPTVELNTNYFQQTKSISEAKIASLAAVRNSDGVILIAASKTPSANRHLTI
jgi:hypothetical protein